MAERLGSPRTLFLTGSSPHRPCNRVIMLLPWWLKALKENVSRNLGTRYESSQDLPSEAAGHHFCNLLLSIRPVRIQMRGRRPSFSAASSVNQSYILFSCMTFSRGVLTLGGFPSLWGYRMWAFTALHTASCPGHLAPGAAGPVWSWASRSRNLDSGEWNRCPRLQYTGQNKRISRER